MTIFHFWEKVLVSRRLAAYVFRYFSRPDHSSSSWTGAAIRSIVARIAVPVWLYSSFRIPRLLSIYLICFIAGQEFLGMCPEFEEED
jgi:hypothetical protein